MLSPDRLAGIAVRALSPAERLVAGLAPGTPSKSPEVDAKLNEWRRVACEDDDSVFRERLAQEGLSVDAARRSLASPAVPSDFVLPEWCRIVNPVLDAMPHLRDEALSGNAPDRFHYLERTDPLPFEELLLPFAEVAGELAVAAGAGTLPAEVSNAFLRDLVRKLSEIAARVLAVEFRAFMAWDSSGRTEPEPNGSGPAPRAQYLSFIAMIYRSGWAPLLEEYCMMTRLLAVTVHQWVTQTVEFQRRLVHDRAEIERLFNAGAPAGAVVAVRPALSDPHHGGRSVIAIEFSSGLKLIYKPRDLGIEKAYFDFVAWINGTGAMLSFRTLRVLDRTGYGWVEHVEPKRCTGVDEIRRYYRRAGNLLCLIFALNGSDFHFENLIAAGEYPVPVDLETIFHHRIKTSAGSDGGQDELTERLRVSVLSTDLLPDPVKVDHRYFDVSALARSEDDEGEADLLVWKDVNTDAMDYAWEVQRPRAAGNLPRLGEAAAAVGDFTDPLLAGFQETYRFLQQNAALLCREDGPLCQLFRHEGRFIFRSTAVYAQHLRRALHPAYLCDGADFGIQLDALSCRLLKSTDRSFMWPLLEAETASLRELDVPRFTALGNDRALDLGSTGRIAGCFALSAWDAARAKIAGLNETDLRWQRSLITGSLDVRIANLGGESAIGETCSQIGDIAPLGQDELIEIAARLANEIEARAFRHANGELNWMVLHYSPATDRYALQAMENDLYNGRAGVALFFAALDSFLPASGCRDRALATLAPVRRWIRDAGDDELSVFGFGGYAGLSSVAYALTRAGVFLEDDELIDDGMQAALRIHRFDIERDRSLDAMGGSAGAIPALLTCHAATGEPEILASAVACGRRLLAARERDQFGFMTWPTLEGRHLTGFSHGAAGIAYSLLQLAKATSDAEFYHAALDAVAFEQCAFDNDYNNWRDYRRAVSRPAEGPAFSMAWCHGAPGIGLGRIAALDVMDTPKIRDEIRAALASTGGVDLLPRDHLCCGNAGLMETLCTAHERFPHQGWSRKARQLAARAVARCDAHGGFSIAFRNGFFNGSLFQGTAGVGYQLLRLADPARVPSVLLLR